MKTILTLIALIPVLSYGQCNSTDNLTTTYNSNNQFDGVMFDVVVGANNAIILNCIETNWRNGGNLVDYEVYIKNGTCMGFDTDPTAWTLQSGGTVLSAGTNNPTLITLDSSIYVNCGEVLGLYITNTNVFQPDMRYTTGTAFGAVYSADANISILEGYGKGPLFGPTFSPRIFNGTLRYDVALCNSLPVELTKFDGDCSNLYWSTASENSNDHFRIESSTDGYTWEIVDHVIGQGWTTNLTNYSLPIYPRSEVTYYRLIQVDYDGAEEAHNTISVFCESREKEILKYIDLMGREIHDVNVTASSIYIIVYTDGTTKKICNGSF